MAEVTQYTFELREITTALIKHQGIHSGIWQLAIEFTMGAGQFDSNGEGIRPGGFLQISKLQLVQPPAGSPKLSYTVDAAEINPAPKAK